jgi:hypothetical protein
MAPSYRQRLRRVEELARTAAALYPWQEEFRGDNVVNRAHKAILKQLEVECERLITALADEANNAS